MQSPFDREIMADFRATRSAQSHQHALSKGPKLKGLLGYVANAVRLPLAKLANISVKAKQNKTAIVGSKRA